jgi:hypothetical protein
MMAASSPFVLEPHVVNASAFGAFGPAAKESNGTEALAEAVAASSAIAIAVALVYSLI